MLSPKQREERDRWIVKDYLAGESIVRISWKHQITPQAIYPILKKRGYSTNRQKEKIKGV